MGGETLTLYKIITLVQSVFNDFAILAVIVGIGMIIYSGLKMAISRGDAAAFGKARTMLWYAIIGLLVIFGTRLIVNTLARFAQSPSSIIY